MSHLWHSEHDYYCPEGCYWATSDMLAPHQARYASWQAFVDDGWYATPKGLNFLYRWDWHAWHLLHPADHDEPCWELELFWIMPRKSIFARTEVVVSPDDEPAVRAWLLGHWRYMEKLWRPVSEESNAESNEPPYTSVPDSSVTRPSHPA